MQISSYNRQTIELFEVATREKRRDSFTCFPSKGVCVSVLPLYKSGNKPTNLFST